MSHSPYFHVFPTFSSPWQYGRYRPGRDLRSKNRGCFLPKSGLLHPRVLLCCLCDLLGAKSGLWSICVSHKFAIGPPPPHSSVPRPSYEKKCRFGNFESSSPSVRNLRSPLLLAKKRPGILFKNLPLRPLLKYLSSYEDSNFKNGLRGGFLNSTVHSFVVRES